MKYFTLLALLFALPALAQFKENQRQELPHMNTLQNGGFERERAKWTKTGASTLTLETAAPYEGTNSGIWDASATSETLTSNPSAVPAGWANKSCLASFQYSWDTGVLGDILFKVQDGGAADLIIAVTLTPTQAGIWAQASAAFPCPSSGTMAIKLESTADAAAIKLDKFWLGQDYRIGETNQAIVTGWTDCTTITSNIPIGGGGTQDCQYKRIGSEMTLWMTFAQNDWDSIGSFNFGAPDGLTIDTSQFPITTELNNVGDVIAYDSSGNTYEVGNVRTDNPASQNLFMVGAQGSLSIWGGSTSRPFDWQNGGDTLSVVTTIPILEWANTGTTNTVTLETQGWHVDASIGGAGISIGTSVVSSKTRISNAGLSLVAAPTSAPVGIACTTSITTATTCSTGDEVTGITFDIPTSGKYLVIGDIPASGSGAADVSRAYFNLAETDPGAALSILQDQSSEPFTFSSSVSGDSYDTHHAASIFNFSSPGKKQIEFVYSKPVSSNSLIIEIDRAPSAGEGDNEMRIRVIKISENFPQAVALTNIVKTGVDLDAAPGGCGDSEFCQGTWTPSYSATSNIDSVTGGILNFEKTKDKVCLYGEIELIDPTATAASIIDTDVLPTSLQPNANFSADDFKSGGGSAMCRSCASPAGGLLMLGHFNAGNIVRFRGPTNHTAAQDYQLYGCYTLN